MRPEWNALRVYAMGLAYRAVDDISRDGFRQLRNYVDMCAFLARSDPQKHFFSMAQDALEKTDSLYYPLIQQVVRTISPDIICNFGVNLGVDALVCGAAGLKKQAQESGLPVTWLTVARADDPGLEACIAEGEERGQFLWVLGCEAETLESGALLAAAHPKSDFALLMPAAAVTTAAADRLAALHNLMVLLPLDSPEITDEVHNAVLLLRAHRMFYGFTVRLTAEAAPTATDSEWLSVLAQHTPVCIYTHPALPAPQAEALLQDIYASRKAAGVPALLFDWEADCATVGRYISPLAQVEYRSHLR